jgi:hypothetical protein
MSSTSTLKLQSEPITQEMFGRLPALLSAYEVKLVTGWNDEELKTARDTRQLETWKPKQPRPGCKQRYCKYLKTSVAKITGFKV